MDKLTRSLRHAIRLLVKSPGFTIAAVATLALGIGANIAIFSLIKAVMLEPLPYRDPNRLVMVWNTANRNEPTHLSLREIVSYRDDAVSFAQVATYTDINANLTGGNEPERVRAAAVSANLFETLGASALLGRTFVDGEDEPAAAATVVLGYGLWQRRFGGASDIVGRTIPVNGRARTIVGVMPASVRLPVDYRADRPSELWIPLVIDRANLGQWGSRSYFGIARLSDGVQPATATSELAVISERWIQAGFVKDSGDGGLARTAIPIQEFVVGDLRRPLFILLGAVGVVLLVACANVVNLLLARADTRRREVAVRAALGASRRQLVRQLLTESAVLAALGGLAGVVMARGGLQALVALRPAGLARVEEVGLDAVALLVAAGLSTITAILFGLAPAVQLSKLGVASVLNETGRGDARGRARRAVRRGLVIVQLAFSVVLVVGATLLLRSLIALNRVDLGFDPDRVLTAQLQLPQSDYPDDRSVIDFYRNLTERLRSLAGVTAAGAARILPLARPIGDWSITIEGRPLATPNENPNGDFQSATPGYFEAMGMSLVRGRLITSADREDAPLVVVINDTMAARYWPGQDALGKRFQMGGIATILPHVSIVGVVRTSRHNAVVEDPRAEIYLPHAQLPRSLGGAGRSMAVVMRTQGDPLAAASVLRQTVRAMDPNLPLADVQTMEQVTAKALAGPSFAASLLGLFAVLALALAAVGTYATISLLVSERAHEIGIRIALGAERKTILAWILGEGLVLAGGGIAIGVAGALFLSRVLETLLYGVNRLDPLTFALVPVLLCVIAVIASLQPARRAASVDPATTLRQA
jgi:putative ABC transport system permease protein